MKTLSEGTSICICAAVHWTLCLQLMSARHMRGSLSTTSSLTRVSALWQYNRSAVVRCLACGLLRILLLAKRDHSRTMVLICC